MSLNPRQNLSSLPAAVNKPTHRPKSPPVYRPNQTPIQARGTAPAVGGPGHAGPPAGVGSTGTRKPGYSVQAPLRLGGQSQQIRATIQGTPQVAGSVDL